jgi:hypothetical protein
MAVGKHLISGQFAVAANKSRITPKESPLSVISRS